MPGYLIRHQQGHDHMVKICSRDRSLSLANVQLEPGGSLRDLRERLRLVATHWPTFPDGLGIVIGDFIICGPEEGKLHVMDYSFSVGD